MINRQVVDSMEALCLDCLSVGVPKSEVIDSIMKLANRCLEEELYEYMDTVKATFYKINKL